MHIVYIYMMQTNKFNDYCIKNFVAFSVLEMSNPGKYFGGSDSDDADDGGHDAVPAVEREEKLGTEEPEDSKDSPENKP